jgi:hypothetical protein
MSIEKEAASAMLWDYVRVEIICPRCVRSIAKYLVPKGQPINLGPAVCPRCDKEAA